MKQKKHYSTPQVKAHRIEPSQLLTSSGYDNE